MLAQVGEFSFVLERAGRDVGLSPAGLGEAGSQAFIATTVVLMVLTPFLTAAGGRRSPARGASRPIPEEDTAAPVLEGPRRENHVVVAGYGEGGAPAGARPRRVAHPVRHHDAQPGGRDRGGGRRPPGAARRRQPPAHAVARRRRPRQGAGGGGRRPGDGAPRDLGGADHESHHAHHRAHALHRRDGAAARRRAPIASSLPSSRASCSSSPT